MDGYADILLVVLVPSLEEGDGTFAKLTSGDHYCQGKEGVEIHLFEFEVVGLIEVCVYVWMAL